MCHVSALDAGGVCYVRFVDNTRGVILCVWPRCFFFHSMTILCPFLHPLPPSEFHAAPINSVCLSYSLQRSKHCEEISLFLIKINQTAICLSFQSCTKPTDQMLLGGIISDFEAERYARERSEMAFSKIKRPL